MKAMDATLAVTAALVFAGALFGLGGVLNGFSHLQHPVSLPGAIGVQRALAYNGLAFFVPGALLAWLAWRLRGRLPPDASIGRRLAHGLLLVATLALIAQGLLPLDLDDINDRGGRLHGAVWMAWWLAFACAQLLLAVTGRRALPRGERIVALGLALVLPLLALGASSWLPAGIAQRLVYLLWFGWWCWQALRNPCRA